MSVTTTKKQTIRDVLNFSDPNELADAMRRISIGELLAVLIADSGGTTVAATTVSAAVAQTGATVATANATDLATSEALANALKVDYNKTITDVAAIVVLLNQARADIIALRAEVVKLGGITEQGLSASSNVVTLAASASQVFQVNATAGTTTGIKKLIPANQVPNTGEVAWDGNKTLTFAAVDAVTTADVMYAKADGSQKASVLLKDFPKL